MQKILLTEQSIFFGDVDMPRDWDIDREQLSQDILKTNINETQFPFSRNWDMLNTYITEHINLNFHINLVSKQTTGHIFKPKETSTPFLQVDPVDLRNSPDYILLYGVHVKDCFVKIFYDDNRRKGRSWDIPLSNNKFIMFPSTNLHYITNKQEENLNFILNISYEYI
tara:strand:+ start:206 stop:709 length:504 start_codon:yes stop_codon:yes gene_type:complete